MALVSSFLACRRRAQHGIAGLVLFAIATVYAAYQVVQGRPEPETWNALAWVILLFTAFNGVSRTLEEDRPRSVAYLRTAVQPLHFMLARTLHNVIVLSGFACLVLFFMGLLMGWADWDGMRIGWDLSAWHDADCRGTRGHTDLLALIAARAGAGFGMTAVLGPSLVLPVVLVSTSVGQRLDVGRVVGRTLGTTSHFLGHWLQVQGSLGPCSSRTFGARHESNPGNPSSPPLGPCASLGWSCSATRLS